MPLSEATAVAHVPGFAKSRRTSAASCKRAVRCDYAHLSRAKACHKTRQVLERGQRRAGCIDRALR